MTAASHWFPAPEPGPRRHRSAAVAAVADMLEPWCRQGLKLLRHKRELQRLSRDEFHYSPVLLPRLAGVAAELAARPATVEQVQAVAAACARHGVPLTVRGAGTGNYGQAVPLLGGVLLETSRLNSIRVASSNVVTAEAGCRLWSIDQALARHGAELRMVPSTYRTATVGGFVAGGSGGIGSVAWGFLRDPGNLLGLEIVTVEPEPQRLSLDAVAAQPLNHAYGCNGIITALTLPTAPARQWREWLIAVPSLTAGFHLANQLRAAPLAIKELALFDEHVVGAVAPLQARCDAAARGCRLLVIAAADGQDLLETQLNGWGAQLLVDQPDAVGNSASLRELTWNHTTLHARAADPTWTYLQLLLPHDPLPVIQSMGCDHTAPAGCPVIAWHLEAVRSQGEDRWAALPLVAWRGLQPLAALMEQARALGCVLFNPHVCTVEDGGLGVVDADQVLAKRRYDPAGLLNPGKLRGWQETQPQP